MQSRLTHFLTLLATLATAVLPAWIDPSQTWPARVALTIVTGLLLAVKTDQLATYRNAILGGLAAAGVLVAALLGRVTAGSAGFAFLGFVGAVITQLRIAFPAKLPAPDIIIQPPSPIDRKPAA